MPETLGRILDVHPSVDSLEWMNLKMAEPVRSFRESRPTPAPEEEGALCVVRADGKGIPMRRPAPEPRSTAMILNKRPKRTGRRWRW